VSKTIGLQTLHGRASARPVTRTALAVGLATVCAAEENLEVTLARLGIRLARHGGDAKALPIPGHRVVAPDRETDETLAGKRR
jgi:hypothetical protein